MVRRVALPEMADPTTNSISTRGQTLKLATQARASKRPAQVVTMVGGMLQNIPRSMAVIQVDLQSDRRNKVCTTRHPPTSPPAKLAMEEMRVGMSVPTVSANNTRPRSLTL